MIVFDNPEPQVHGKEKIKFNIIAFANSFWATEKGLAGGDRRAIEIFKRFKTKEQINLKIMITKMGYENYKSYIDLEDFNVILCPSIDRLGIFVAYLIRSVVACFLRLKLRKNDIIYSISDFLPDVLPVVIRKSVNKGIKWVQIIHHLIPSPSRRTGFFLINLISFYAQRISLFLIKRFADLVIVVNPLIKGELEKYGFNKALIRINYNGVNFSFFKKIEPDHKRVFDAVFLGRLHFSKGVFDLPDIWSEVCKKNEDAKLGIIGGGDKRIRKKLEEKISNKRLEEKIVVLGYLNDEEAFSIIKSSKIFVFPSYEEGWGISVCEAMACGLPVVTWDLPIYSILFPDGRLSAPIGDIKSFADKILKLLSDQQLYAEKRREAFSIVSKYDWNNIAEKELKLLIGLLN